MKVIPAIIFLITTTLTSGQSVKLGDVRLSPRLLNYQGYLTDTQGNPITNPSVSLLFAIFDSPSGGSQKWSETQPSVAIDKGIFNVLLGSVTPIPDSVFTASTSRYLQLTVAGQTLSPRTQIVSTPYAYTSTYSDTAQYSRNSAPDKDWTFRITDTADTTLQMGGRWGLARASAVMYGNADSTHVNFGFACTTGTSGANDIYCTVSGGSSNAASYNGATVAGGYSNAASYHYAAVAGGYQNTADNLYASIGGGSNNEARGSLSTIAGGYQNTAMGNYSSVCGGYRNTAWGYWSAVAGGYADTAGAYYSFATNYSTFVDNTDTNSAAFTTSHTTAKNQVRAAAFSTGTMDYAMDHPSDPMNKILNQYGISSDEVMSIYRGSVVLDANGRATVILPGYFDGINRNPMIQLTGVGTPDVVYVAEDVKRNQFAIGGKPGMKVYWQVTAERKDIHAEIARIQTPVVQEKKGGLKGHSIDDDAMIGIYDGLHAKNPELFQFKTEEGRGVHEQSKKLVDNK